MFWVFIVVFNLFYRRGPQLFISRKSLMFQRSCGGGGGSNINRPYASYRTCDFQGGPDPPPPPPDTRTLHMPYMYSVYVKTVGTSSHPERGWSEGVQLWQLFSCRGKRECKYDLKWAIIGPSVKRHLNGVMLAGR